MRPQKVLRAILFVAFFVFFVQILRQGVETVHQTLCNSGAVFGVAVPQGILFFLTLGTLFFFSVQWWKEEDIVLSFGWLILFSAGASNLFERTFFGCVTDYIFLPYFPACNIADVVLTIAVLVMAFRFRKNIVYQKTL